MKKIRLICESVKKTLRMQAVFSTITQSKHRCSQFCQKNILYIFQDTKVYVNFLL